MPEQNFEQQARNMVEGFRLEPQPAVWQQVQTAIAQPKRKRRILLWWWLLPLCLAGGVALLYPYQQKVLVKTQSSSKPASHSTAAQPTLSKPGLVKKDAGKQVINKPSNNLTQRRNNTVLLFPPQKNNDNKTEHKQNLQSFVKIIQEKNTTDSAQQQDAALFANHIATIKTLTDSTVIAANVTDKQLTDTVKTTDLVSSSDSVQLKNDSAATVIKTKKRNSKQLHVGIMAEAGIATSGNKWNSSKAFAASDNITGLPQNNSGGVVISNVVQLKIKQGINAAIGVAMQKPVSRRLQLAAQLAYRYQYFAVLQTVQTDSIVSGNLYSRGFSSGNADYRLHFVNLYTGINWQLFAAKQYGVAVQTGLDNSWLLAIQHRQDASLSGVLESFTANNFYRWQPHLYTAVGVSFNTNHATQLQLLPFARFGVKEFRKGSLSYQDNHLVSAGLQAICFFK